MGKKRSAVAPGTYRVFVSHATYDKWVARVLCEKIEALGLSTFRDDRDIAGGDRIPESIRDAIEESQEVVVLLSPQSVARPWVLLEIGMAIAYRKRIVPILFHLPAEQIPDIIDLNRGFSIEDLDQYLRDLKTRATSNVE